MGPRTDPETRERAARQVAMGEQPAAELARQLGVRSSTVWYWARRYAAEHGLPPPASQRGPQRRRSLADELLAGATTQEELVERLKAHRNAARERASSAKRAQPQAGKRARVPYEEQQSAIKQYLQRKASARELAAQHGVSITTIHYWVRGYRTERGIF
ncbi:MAG: helix-turn-helix domain-containing protein [Segniliparus sp.]|uniref:helix-turn-helix domain-containing protein n=1 Tax=Segniliparus sp. TaxID=2804064 RepID=UPI003F4167C2